MQLISDTEEKEAQISHEHSINPAQMNLNKLGSKVKNVVTRRKS